MWEGEIKFLVTELNINEYIWDQDITTVTDKQNICCFEYWSLVFCLFIVK